jgi:Protein of unknown function (DUF3768)
VRGFAKFEPANDPYGEHDFGAVDVAGQKFFWKIDYYDKAMEMGSDDPADPAKTTQRADDYAGERILRGAAFGSNYLIFSPSHLIEATSGATRFNSGAE